jgi:hypothetical protein
MGFVTFHLIFSLSRAALGQLQAINDISWSSFSHSSYQISSIQSIKYSSRYRRTHGRACSGRVLFLIPPPLLHNSQKGANLVCDTFRPPITLCPALPQTYIITPFTFPNPVPSPNRLGSVDSEFSLPLP